MKPRKSTPLLIFSTVKLFVTGGTGFFGKALLRHHLFSAELDNKEITVLSRNPDRFLAAYPEFGGHHSITFLKGDVQQRESLPWGHSFTHVLHAATESTIGPSLTPLQRYDVSPPPRSGA
jgi:UDP-glucuronate decarboxylase